MTFAMIFASYLQNLNVHSYKMTEKAMFESIKLTVIAKKITFSEKTEQIAVKKKDARASEKL